MVCSHRQALSPSGSAGQPQHLCNRKRRSTASNRQIAATTTAIHNQTHLAPLLQARVALLLQTRPADKQGISVGTGDSTRLSAMPVLVLITTDAIPAVTTGTGQHMVSLSAMLLGRSAPYKSPHKSGICQYSQ